MNKHIVHLSDTSHPFTSYTDEPDNKDNTPKWERSWHNDPKHNDPDESDMTSRTLTSWEFDAIRAFQSNWGFVGNHDISDDLVDMLADTDTDPEKLISRFLRKWDLSPERDYVGIRTDVENLFVLRATVETPAKPTFTPDEIEALKSLPGEKSDKWTEKPLTLSEYNKAGKSTETLRKELFEAEADKRVTRYFIGQTGWAWYVHFIVDMPEQFDETLPNVSKTLLRSKDGMTTLHMTSLYMSEEKAWERIHEDIRSFSRFDDESLTHVVELDKM